jgi:broad specificity phosphatase PhoE
MSLPRGLLTARDLVAWRDRYDLADIVDVRLDAHAIPWQRCISSDLPRAVRTAEQLFTGPIEQTPLLREPHVAEFATGRLRLPANMWHWVLRASWMTGHSSQQAARDEFRARMTEFEETVLASIEVDTLIVSHAGVMLFLRAILTRLGFTGPHYRLAEHGKLYLFERN